MKNGEKMKLTTPSDREVVVTRVFDAPRRLVWRAMSEPELLKRWIPGPPGWPIVRCDQDWRVGGAFHFAWRGPDGSEMTLSGIFSEVVPPERVVRTESFVIGVPPRAGEQLATLVLTEQGGKTTLTLTVQYPSKEARDAAIVGGMNKGLAEGYDRLDEVFASSVRT
jgi:uncharacterized protein YndB with AHSA1/START domain